MGLWKKGNDPMHIGGTVKEKNQDAAMKYCMYMNNDTMFL